MLGWVPGVQAISSYRREWLAKDIVAGIVLTTLLVPQGMAYAELAGLPPITGLYTSSCAWPVMRCSARRGSWCWARIPPWADDRGDDLAPTATPSGPSRSRRRSRSWSWPPWPSSASSPT
jgi:hypothetical protein